MNIYFIQYECLPIAGSENASEYGGAFISGWIAANNMGNAKEIYKKTIQSSDWLLMNLEDSYEVDPSRYDESDEELDFYNQSKLDGEVYCVDAWSNEYQNTDVLQ